MLLFSMSSVLNSYYTKFDDALVYYAATILYLHYKHYLKALWKVPETHNLRGMVCTSGTVSLP
jgi:hypothetical protein